jgi:hypothetical protein
MTNEVARLGGNIDGLVPAHVRDFLLQRAKKAGVE